MKVIKKTHWTLSLLLICSLVLSACGSSGGSDSSSNGGKGGKKTQVRIMTRLSGSDLKSKAFNELLDKFKKENPDIEVVNESVNDETSYNNKFKTAVATGNVPNIWMNYGGQSFKVYAENIAMDLQPVLDEDKAWSGAFKPLFSGWQYSDIQGTFAVPMEDSSVAIYYNKDLFKKAGVEPPKTIEEMTALVEPFKKIGAVPMLMGDKENFRGGHLINNLSFKRFGFQKIEDLISRKAKWNDPDMLQLFQLMKDWQSAGVLGDNIVTLDSNGTTAQFLAGKSAMLFEGNWAISQLSSSDIADKIGVIPFPYFADHPENKDVWFGTAGGYSVSKSISGAEKDATIKLLKYLTNEDAFKYFAQATKGGTYPVNVELDSSQIDPVTKEYMEAQKSAKTFLSEIETYDNIPSLQDKLRSEIQGMFAGSSPQQTADNVQKVVDSNH
ncbi:extracellular solute-binding protein [Paenibacillus dokdonensis]|uniref:extracellular solute-binding protein n=1 Tax=Paenibacillus dokdonensis TaxID=2567944 RepID=UPI0010A86EB2|nr:extracellular solute-binding protein [Paenibacillus dokdonensis]